MSNFHAELDKQGLRGFLGFVGEKHPDQLLRLTEPVRSEYEMTAIVFELERAGRCPVVVFENVVGQDMPVAPSAHFPHIWQSNIKPFTVFSMTRTGFSSRP